MSKRRNHDAAFKARVALEAPQGETAMNLDLMLLIDKQFLETPFYGVQQMTWHLHKSEGPWPRWGRVSPKTAMLGTQSASGG